MVTPRVGGALVSRGLGSRCGVRACVCGPEHGKLGETGKKKAEKEQGNPSESSRKSKYRKGAGTQLAWLCAPDRGATAPHLCSVSKREGEKSRTTLDRVNLTA